MADVEIKYNNSTIASLNDSGTEVLETKGAFLTDDITVEYTKSGGGVLVVTVGESNICDASYNDVISAVAAGKVVMLKTSAGGTGFPFGYKYLVSYMEHQGQYAVAFGEHYDVCTAQSATDALVVME